MLTNPFIIANKEFSSRLMIGTGKYENVNLAIESIKASESSIVTVSVRRLNLTSVNNHESLINKLDWEKLWLLPNTAGAKTAEDAIRLAFLGRELAKQLNQCENNFVKLEVISDSKYLLPDPIGTFKAANFLVKKGFCVLPYISPDPMLARHLQDIGCATLMPLGSPIGSGQGIKNIEHIKIIIEEAQIPVIIDAGIGTATDASFAMELGADAVLINTAIAKAKNPIIMAQAMKLAVQAGFLSNWAGSITPKSVAHPSSTALGSNFLSSYNYSEKFLK